MSNTIQITVKVYPGAKKERLIVPDCDGDAFEAYVREPAQHNLANKAVRALIAAHFALEQGAVRILTGHRSPKKRLEVIMSRK